MLFVITSTDPADPGNDDSYAEIIWPTMEAAVADAKARTKSLGTLQYVCKLEAVALFKPRGKK